MIVQQQSQDEATNLEWQSDSASVDGVEPEEYIELLYSVPEQDSENTQDEHCHAEANEELAADDVFQINDEIFDRLEDSLNKLRAFNTRLKARYESNTNTQTQTQSAPTEDSETAQTETSAKPGKGFVQTIQTFFVQSLAQPQVVAKRYGAFAEKLLEIIQQDSQLTPERGDRRFKDQVWKENILYRSVLQVYIAWKDEMQGWLDDLELSAEDEERAQFIMDQLTAAAAPSNFPWNPTAVKRAYQTGGTSVVTGVKELVDDVLNNRGMPKQIRRDAYQVGKDLGLSPGEVVYRDERLELIQYKPLTNEIRQRPILLIPPQINKFYIFDLTPKSSIVKHLLQSGIQVYIISWKNPGKADCAWGMDEYIQSTMGSIDAACDISESKDVNLISACAGGLTSMSLLGYLAETKQPKVHSHSLLVTSLEAHNGSILDLFTTQQLVESARERSAIKGLMDGNELAKIFAWLRPNDLVWSYWVNNYLLGKEPPALDVLYWDNDSTRLPAQLHSDFLDIFSKECFTQANTFSVLGKDIDFSKITMDTYFVGGTEDYLMPWRSCYLSQRLVKGNHSFVLSTSGHVQSILRPPHIANTAFYTNDDLSLDPDDWYAGATKNDGSWWPHWASWLNERSGEMVSAPETLGNCNYPPITPAPGEYVFER